MKKFTSIAAAFMVAGMAFTSNAADIYLVGDLTDYKELGGFAFDVDEENPNLYTLESYIPAGYFDFYFTLLGAYTLIPATGETANVNFTDGRYTCDMIMGMEPVNFVDENWEGGDVEFEILIDEIQGTAVLTVTTVEQPEKFDLYLVGEPNDYTDGLEAWGLRSSEDDAYQFYGTFNIPAGEFKFYFSFWGGYPLVPATAANASVVFEEGEFTGNLVLGAPAYWEDPEWEGGEVSILLNVDPYSIEGTVTFTVDNESNAVQSVDRGNENLYRVYNLQGVKVMEGTSLDTLRPGLYIINGKKTLIR